MQDTSNQSTSNDNNNTSLNNTYYPAGNYLFNLQQKDSILLASNTSKNETNNFVCIQQKNLQSKWNDGSCVQT